MWFFTVPIPHQSLGKPPKAHKLRMSGFVCLSVNLGGNQQRSLSRQAHNRRSRDSVHRPGAQGRRTLTTKPRGFVEITGRALVFHRLETQVRLPSPPWTQEALAKREQAVDRASTTTYGAPWRPNPGKEKVKGRTERGQR